MPPPGGSPPPPRSPAGWSVWVNGREYAPGQFLPPGTVTMTVSEWYEYSPDFGQRSGNTYYHEIRLNFPVGTSGAQITAAMDLAAQHVAELIYRYPWKF